MVSIEFLIRSFVAYIHASAMFFRAHSATFTQSTIVRAGMNAAIFRNPIAFAHALVTYTFALV